MREGLRFCGACFASVLLLASAGIAASPTNVNYHIFGGNTHSHTTLTWSHGEQYVNEKTEGGKEKETGIQVATNGVQSATKSRKLKPDWEKVQGPPAKHYALAKANGYDFYVTTDHSQEAAFHPTNPTNANWVATKQAASKATDAHFVAIAGYEHSENNGPGGNGHINVINSAEYLNALEKGVDLPFFYHWLKHAAANGEGPVVACFNHPGVHQYNDWAYRDPEITDVITLLEVINSNKRIHYGAFVSALDKGWKVSPVCGNDNHGFWGITHHTSRTFVLAANLTKAAILEGMKNHRTYAALDQNIQCQYTVNGAIMGSTLSQPDVFHFDISINDPDTSNPKHQITRIDIVKDGGAVVQEHKPVPAYSVHWSPTIADATNRYFFVRVWNAGGGQAADGNPANPMAWLAPVWTGR